MIKGIIEEAVLDILRERKLIDDPLYFGPVKDTQTRVNNIEDVLKNFRKELEGLSAALEICYTDDIDIEKKYRHTRWKDITRQERDLLCKRYDIAFGFSIGMFSVFETDYIGDSLQSKKRWDEMAKQAIESSTKKAKKNARRK